MRLPDYVNVLHFKVKVLEIEFPEESKVFGDWDCSTMTIHVEVGSRRASEILDVLMHEINHVIYWVYALDDTDEEERIVQVMATAWVDILCKNPKLLAMINKVAKLE